MNKDRYRTISKFGTCIFTILFSGYVLAVDCDDTNRELEPFSAGEGSDFDPYLVCTPHQFNQIGEQHADKHFVIGSDLDFSQFDGNSGMLFNMIGSDSKPFTGSMDGQGHVLNNIHLTTIEAIKDKQLLGVFRKTDKAIIRNLQVKIDIGGELGLKAYVGGLIGSGNLTLIDNVQIETNMRGANYAGGLAGVLKSSQATNIDVTGTMQLAFGNDAVGGVVGMMENTSLEAVHANMKIGNLNDKSIAGVGGIVGAMLKSQLCNSYSDGNIEIAVEANQKLDTEGVAGLVSAAQFSVIKMVYMNGTVTPDADATSPISLNVINDQKSQSVFWNITKEPHAATVLGKGVTADKLKQVKWLKSKGFMPEIWKMKKGTFPTLKRVESLYLQCKNPEISQD